jgi:hypothetical protein
VVKRVLWVVCAAALAGCANWEQLSCARGVCDGGVVVDAGVDAGINGPFFPQQTWNEAGGAPLVAFLVGDTARVVGDTARVVVTPQTIATFDSQGPHEYANVSGLAWTLGAAGGTPASYWVVDSAQQVHAWGTSIVGPSLGKVSPSVPYPVDVVVPYVAAGGEETAAAFGAQGGGTVATEVVFDGGTAQDHQDCTLRDPRGVSFSNRTTSLVVGVGADCSGGGAQQRYLATLWPRDTPSPAAVTLSAETAPTRARVSSNGLLSATIAYEVTGGISVARLSSTGTLERNVLSVSLSTTSGGSVSLVLDDVQVSASGDRFVYALSNRSVGVLSVKPDGSAAPAVEVPPGATLLVFNEWVLTGSRVFSTQLLRPVRPFTALRFARATFAADVWLAVSCAPPSPSAGAEDPFCGSATTRHVLLRWVP